MNKLFSSPVATATVNPFTALEALQEITDICNSIQLSTPAFEALMELPSLAREFDNASPPMLAMLNFVAEQHYDTLGLTNVSVSQEGIVSSIGEMFMKFIKWLMDTVERISAWITGLFKRKPVEKLEDKIDGFIEKAKADVRAEDAAEKAKGTDNGFVMSPEESNRRQVALKGMKAFCGKVTEMMGVARGLAGDISHQFEKAKQKQSAFATTNDETMKQRLTKLIQDFNFLTGVAGGFGKLTARLLTYLDKTINVLGMKKEIDYDVFKQFVDTLQKVFHLYDAYDPLFGRVLNITKANVINIDNVDYNLHEIDQDTKDKIKSIHEMTGRHFDELDSFYGRLVK